MTVVLKKIHSEIHSGRRNFGVVRVRWIKLVEFENFFLILCFTMLKDSDGEPCWHRMLSDGNSASVHAGVHRTSPELWTCSVGQKHPAPTTHVQTSGYGRCTLPLSLSLSEVSVPVPAMHVQNFLCPLIMSRLLDNCGAHWCTQFSSVLN